MATMKEIYDPRNYLFGIDDYKERAILRLRQAAEFSEHLGLGPLYVCFSGGKDSVALYGACKLAFGDQIFEKCEFHYSITGLDHPELVYFIRREYPFVKRDIYEKSIWQLTIEQGMPPTMVMRFCCKELKERGGYGRFIATGVRWAESRKRADRGAFETAGRRKKDMRVLNADNDEDRQELEHCIPKRKYICNPLIDWPDEVTWRFIIEQDLPYCKLYDEGWKRMGCLGCPMGANKAEELEIYPKLKEQWIRTFDKMLSRRRELGKPTNWETGQEVFDWWINI